MRKPLTPEIVETSKMVSATKSIPLLKEMKQCKDDGWSLELYMNYLEQFFSAESIQAVIPQYWKQF